MCLKLLFQSILCSVLLLAPKQKFELPGINELFARIEFYYATLSDLQCSEVAQSTKYRWLSYLPNPGYSPFTGGFTVSLNLASPLQEIRLTHTQKTKQEVIRRTNKLLAADLKNSIRIDYGHIENLISDFHARSRIDSLNTLMLNLAKKKYQNNEITPTEFITAYRTWEEYQLSRKREEAAICEAINDMLYKAKMDVPASNAHLDTLNHK